MAYTKFTTRFTEFDSYLFKAGKHYRIYEKLGSHLMTVDGEDGTYFAVWAPNAKQVSVIGNFNYWNKDEHLLNPRYDGTGVWEGFIPNVGHGEVYKYYIISNVGGMHLEKGDPYARYWEQPPRTASIVWDSSTYEWDDDEWMAKRDATADEPKPYSVYEVHLGSWKHKSAKTDDWLSYKELAKDLVEYVADMGFTHIELMPIMEHPYGPSWGYQQTGYFAPTSRFGSPEEFKYLVNAFHKAGIGVICDWVPSHFPEDAHGLGLFDGTHLYEHADPRKGFHPDWKSLIFNYGRNEVRSFLISNAVFWLEQFHIDGLRVDAVASMLYLDYSRNDGEWIPNMYGGNENLEAISFLKEFNETVYKEFPSAVTIAEESTAFSGVSRPTYQGGLGFGQKWMMGWMHDTLTYFKKDPIYRKFHQGDITFSLVYAFSENFMLPLSHDEVVHGKGSLLTRMPGDDWQRFANLRCMFGYMYTHPGMQLIFQGGEYGQVNEWNFEQSLDWHLLHDPMHKGMQTWIKDLNTYFKNTPALYEYAFEPKGFEWISMDDHQNSVLAYARKGKEGSKTQIVVCNLTPNVLSNYRIGVLDKGTYSEVINSDDAKYGGSGVGNTQIIKSEGIAWHGQENSIVITLPPLGVVAFEIED